MSDSQERYELADYELLDPFAGFTDDDVFGDGTRLESLPDAKEPEPVEVASEVAAPMVPPAAPATPVAPMAPPAPPVAPAPPSTTAPVVAPAPPTPPPAAPTATPVVPATPVAAPAPPTTAPSPKKTPAFRPAQKSAPKPSKKVARPKEKPKKEFTYDKQKITRSLVLAGLVVALIVSALTIFFIASQVETEDFVGTNASEVSAWGIQSGIIIEEIETYSYEYDVGIVIAQDIDAGNNVSRGSTLTIEVSKGLDMSELIVLPDFSVMTIAEVQRWREEAKAVNAIVREEYSPDVVEGRFIRYEFADPTTARDSYERSQRMLIFMSRGPQAINEDAGMPNFYDRPLAEVEEWAREVGVGIALEEADHEGVAVGNVVGQCTEPGEEIFQGDTFTFQVFLGTPSD